VCISEAFISDECVPWMSQSLRTLLCVHSLAIETVHFRQRMECFMSHEAGVCPFLSNAGKAVLFSELRINA
jgi:hypothetical protein